jgi:putative ABC transport system ATP-binding protein
VTVLFETRGLCKYYRPGARTEVRALHDVSLSIEGGSFTVLVGPSGSGKTTLLALLGALDRPTRGQVVFEGRDLTPLSDVELTRFRRRIGFVFQDFALIPGLAAWENVTYPLIPRGVPRRQRFKIAQGILAQLGLADRDHALPRELSTGEQQRVAVARALAGQPEVIIADEPTASLDRKAAVSLLALLQQIHQQGTTVVVGSHDPAVRALATTVYDLHEGQLPTTPPMSGD